MRFTPKDIIELGLIRKRNRCALCGREMDVPNYNIQLCSSCRKKELDEFVISEGKVFIERASPLTKEGIRAVCGTEEEYKKYTEDLKSESSDAKLGLGEQHE